MELKVGDKVETRTWVYAISTKFVLNRSEFVKAGAKGEIVRICGDNAVVVKFQTGRAAPLHPAHVKLLEEDAA